jgi:hypothetical protein
MLDQRARRDEIALDATETRRAGANACSRFLASAARRAQQAAFSPLGGPGR